MKELHHETTMLQRRGLKRTWEDGREEGPCFCRVLSALPIARLPEPPQIQGSRSLYQEQTSQIQREQCQGSYGTRRDLKEQSRRHRVPDFKLRSKARTGRTALDWDRHWCVDQRSRIGKHASTDTVSWLSFGKRVRSMCWRKKSLFDKQCWEHVCVQNWN